MNIVNYDARDILARVWGAGVCDVDFFLNTLNKLDLDFDEVESEVESLGSNKNDINAYIYSCFYLSGHNFIDAVKEYMEENNLFSEDIDGDVKEFFGVENFNLEKEVIENFEIYIYVNYLDSGFDCKLSDYNTSDLREENIKNFIIDLYDLEIKKAS
ncbi:hypothetical protein PT447_00160 [Aliarcobacter butzleri]|uniref:hypothetical protein n=1 Tax=Aliarcobacter butzleri TaxID=28197 RepID=UPI0024DE068A|nr:hypothetical protein [Aliarcobacter butzleri]MDK2063332.1 hypothetical protein [Aliarcobacter butzleri]